MSHQDSAYRKARKSHWCVVCGNSIVPGEHYHVHLCIEDGLVGRWKCCDACAQLLEWRDGVIREQQGERGIDATRTYGQMAEEGFFTGKVVAQEWQNELAWNPEAQRMVVQDAAERNPRRMEILRGDPSGSTPWVFRDRNARFTLTQQQISALTLGMLNETPPAELGDLPFTSEWQVFWQVFLMTGQPDRLYGSPRTITALKPQYHPSNQLRYRFDDLTVLHDLWVELSGRAARMLPETDALKAYGLAYASMVQEKIL